MTAGNFAPGQDGEQGASPGLFGISFTPKIQGILIGVVGLGLSCYVAYAYILPVLNQRQELEVKIKDSEQKKNQLEQQKLQKKRAESDREKAQERRGKVTTFFASESTMETLILDINRLVNQINGGIADETQKAKLTKFDPIMPKTVAVPPGAIAPDGTIVNDGTLGTLVNGKLRRLQFNVGFEGDFRQTQAFMRDLERLQSLLLVKSLQTQLSEANKVVKVEFKDGRIVPMATLTQPKLNTTFELQALLPLSSDSNNAKSSPSPSASPSPK